MAQRPAARSLDGIKLLPQKTTPERLRFAAVTGLLRLQPWRTVIIIASLLLGTAAGMAIGHWHSSVHGNQNDVIVVSHEVGRHLLLPGSETPALATVTDRSKLQSSFQQRLENGDKVLIYQQAKKAIVYRPSIDRIVDVEPLILNSSPSTSIPDIDPFNSR